MSERVVYRVRCTVTRDWKCRAPDGSPMDFFSRAKARNAARFLKRWHLVKVTIRSRRT